MGYRGSAHILLGCWIDDHMYIENLVVGEKQCSPFGQRFGGIPLFHPPSFIGFPGLHIYMCVFLALRHLFLFRPRVFPRALGSVARREPVRTPHASLGPSQGPWHVLWGSKWQVRSGRDSEHVEPSRPMQTHVNDTLLTGYKNVRRLM